MVQLKQRVSVMWPTLGTLTGFRIGKREAGVHMDGAISLGSGYQRVRS